MDDALLKSAEVCDMFRCSERSLNRMVEDKLLHPIRIRGMVRYRRAEVVYLIEVSGFDPDDVRCECDGECGCADGMNG